MLSGQPDWLEVRPGDAPLIVALPHVGTQIPPEIERQFHSGARARRDADWWVDRLYDFAPGLGATTVRTALSRSVIDVNRDPSGASLYPGQATTGLCPTTTFDGEPLYADGSAGPGPAEIEARRRRYFQPYHAALQGEIARLRARHGAVVVYDAHAIRSAIPRLFEGTLPELNVGTNGGGSCDAGLTRVVADICGDSAFSHVVDGRFRGGWTTRHHGRPVDGVHAIQMELAFRAFVDEPVGPVDDAAWPASFDPARAAPLRQTLERVLGACLAFARAHGASA